MAHRRKAGRKKKQGPRTPSGKPSRAWQTVAKDFGTLELQTKRRALVGENADPDLSATAVGILFAHGHLDREQYEKALEYARLSCAVYGVPWPKTPSYREITDKQALKVKRALNTMLAKLSADQRLAIDRTALASNWQPTWFHCLRLGLPLLPADNQERAALLSGLDALLDRTPANAAAA
jgi:hypothetical protein